MKLIQLGGHKQTTRIKGYAIVEDEDFKTLSQHKWSLANGYAMRTIFIRTKEGKYRHRNIYMAHAVIGKPPAGQVVDHINGEKLDNRRANLRIASYAQNSQNKKRLKTNTIGFRGVTFHALARKFQAQIMVNGKQIYLGLFSTPANAARARRQATLKYHGQFARLT